MTNVGVAAHISGASPGSARYDESLTDEQRSAASNGIWLCQTHAKLVDDDELTYTKQRLLEWKDVAEHMAALEARGYTVRRARPFADIEKKVPELFAEMRADLKQNPLVREFIVLKKNLTYNGRKGTTIFRYCPAQHPDLLAIMTILEHHGAIYNAAFNDVPRYKLTEEFVSHLRGE